MKLFDLPEYQARQEGQLRGFTPTSRFGDPIAAAQHRQELREQAAQRSMELKLAMEARRVQKEQDDKSWANKLASEGSLFHDYINLQASGVSAAGRLAGGALSMPFNLAAMDAEGGVSDEAREAFEAKLAAETAGDAIQNVRTLTPEQREAVGMAQRVVSQFSRPDESTLSERDAAKLNAARDYLDNLRADIQGRFTEEQQALLNEVETTKKFRPRQHQEFDPITGTLRDVGLKVEDPLDVIDGTSRPERTNEERLRAAEMNRNVAGAVTDFFDWSDIVHQGNMREFSADLAQGSSQGLEKLKESWRQLNSDGEMQVGIINMADAIAELIVSGGDAVLSNPMAVLQVGVEQIPQLALAKASGGAYALSMIGQGVDLYRQGYENYMEANNGQHPPEELREHMAINSAGYALAMFTSDQTMLRMITPALVPGRMAAVDLGSRAANIARAGAVSGGVEAFAEGYQTYAEGEATNQPSSLFDIYEGVVLGKATGAGIAAAGRTINEFRGNTEQDLHNAGVAQAESRRSYELASAMVEAGTPEVLLDETNENYSPLAAAQAYALMLSQNTDGITAAQVMEYQQGLSRALEAAEENARTASKLVQESDADRRAAVTQKIEGLQRAIDSGNLSDVTLAKAQEHMKILQGDLETLDATESVRTDKETIKEREKQLKKAESDLRAISNIHSRVKPPVDVKATQEQVDRLEQTQDPDAATNVIVAAMVNRDNLSAETAVRLADNMDLPFSESQREFLRRFSDAQAAVNQIKTTNDVHSNVMEGDRAGNFIGLRQHQERIATALASQNEAQAVRYISKLGDFAVQRQSKAEAMQEALEAYQKDGKSRSILPIGGDAQLWGVSESLPSKRDRDLSGALVVDGKSHRLAAVLKQEATAAVAAHAAMESALAVYKELAGNSMSPGASGPVTAVSTASQQDSTTSVVQEGTNETSEVSPTPGTDAGPTAETRPVQAELNVPQAQQEARTLVADAAAWNNLGEVTSEAELTEANTLFDQTSARAKELFTQVAQGHPDPQVRQQAQEALDSGALDTEVLADTLASMSEVLGAPTESDIAVQQQSNTEVSTQDTMEDADGYAEYMSSLDAAPVSANEGPAPAPRVTPQPQLSELSLQVMQEYKQGKQAGKLEVFRHKAQQRAARVSESSKARINRVKNAIGQRLRKSDQGTVQPLVEIENFIEHMDAILDNPEMAAQFLGRKTTLEERVWLARVAEMAELFHGIVHDSLPKELFDYQGVRVDSATNQKDWFYGLLKEDGTLDKNLTTAMAVAAMSYVAEQGTMSAPNTAEMIAKMFGNPYMHVPKAMQRGLSGVGARHFTVSSALGRRAAQTLGAYALPDADMNAMAKFEQALGNRILAAMDHLGLVQKHVVKQGTIDNWLAEDDPEMRKQAAISGRANIQHQFYSMNTRKGEGRTLLLDAYEDSLGAGNILGDLFGMETNKKVPGFKPVKYAQTSVKNTNRGVPSGLAAILSKENQNAETLRLDTVAVLEAIDDSVIHGIHGWVDTAGKPVHRNKEKTVKGKNLAAERSLRSAKDFIAGVRNEDPSLTKEYFFNRVMWLPGRVGLAENGFNPQSDKLHRILTKMEGWSVDADMTNQADFINFWLAVGEGLDVATDAQSIEDSVAEAQTKYEDPTIKAGVLALAEALKGTKLSPEQNAAVAAAVAKGKGGFHSLDALIGLAHYWVAGDGAVPFQHSLTREVDGKTNGPMLAMLMLGAAGNERGGDFQGVLEAGGFFSVQTDFTQVAAWAAVPTNHDMYKQVAADLGEFQKEFLNAKPEAADTLDAVAYFMGQVVDPEDGAVTPAGRKLVKQPVTALIFGSGLKSIKSGMADEFLDSVYDQMEAAANNNDAAELERIRYWLNKMVGEEVFKRPFTITTKDGGPGDAYNTFLKHEPQIRNAFIKTFGEVIGETMQHRFGAFMARRDALNASANAAFDLYKFAYEYEKQKVVRQMMAKGTMAYTKQDGMLIPDGEISKEQDAAIRAKLKHMEPVMHSAWSKLSGENGELENGIYLAKADRSGSDELSYRTATQLADGFVGYNSINTKGQSLNDLPPGVRAVILAIHSMDSYIASQAYSKLNALNVHDAEIVRADQAAEVAKLLNQATYEIMGKYSVAAEIHAAYERTLEGFLNSTYKEINPDSAQGATLKKLMHKHAVKYMRRNGMMIYRRGQKPQPDWKEFTGLTDSVFTLLLADSSRAAQKADVARYGALATMKAVDQYPMWDGNYLVTPDDRKANAELRDAAAARGPKTSLIQQGRKVKETYRDIAAYVPPESEEGSLIRASDPIPEADMEPLFDAAATRKDPRADNPLVLPPALVQDLIHRHQLAEANDVIATLQDRITANPTMNLEQALASMPAQDAALALQILGEELARLGSMSVWGKIGASRTGSNPALVSYFLKQGNRVPAREVVAEVKRQLLSQQLSKPLRDAYLALLGPLAQAIPKETTVTMVRPGTRVSDVSDVLTPQSGARGYFSNEGKHGDSIVLLGPAFSDSGLTMETVLHELLHAALSNAIVNPSNPQAVALVKNLEEIYAAVGAFMTPEQKTKFAPAMKDLDEMVAWGLTNKEFQDEVLSKVTFSAPEAKRLGVGKLIDGIARLLNDLTTFLFHGKAVSERERGRTALGLIAANATVLMQNRVKAREDYAKLQRQQQDPDSSDAVIIAQQQNQAHKELFEMTSEELFNAMGKDANTPQLAELLHEVVTRIHGPGGKWIQESFKGGPQTALEAMTEAVNTGVAAYASASNKMGFKLNAQQQFVLEQLEISLNEALSLDVAAYKALREIWQEARAQLSPASFYDGDFSQASKPERDAAQAKYDHLFKVVGNANGMSRYLSQFAALASVDTNLREKLGFDMPVKGTDLSRMSLGQKIKHWLTQALRFLGDRMLKIKDGEKSNERLDKMLRRLAKSHEAEAQRQGNGVTGMLDRISDMSDGVGGAIRNQVGRAVSSPALINSKTTFVRAPAKFAYAMAQGHMDQVMRAARDSADVSNNQKEKILGALVTEVQGAWDDNQKMAQAFLRGTKRIEAERLKLTEQTAKQALAAFAEAGINLADADKEAITKTFLKTDMASLINRYDLSQIDQMLTDPSAEVAVLEQELLSVAKKHNNFYVASARAAAYEMVWGIASAEKVMLNAHNIAHLYGTKHAKTVSSLDGSRAEAVLDQLITLYALQYMDKRDRLRAQQVLRTEMARSDGGNGVEFVLQLHASQKARAKEKLFYDSPVQMRKGYVNDLYNANISVKAIPVSEWKHHESLGYEKLSKLSVDPALGTPGEEQILVRIRDGGKARRVSGSLSNTGEAAAGSAIHGGLTAVGKAGIFQGNLRKLQEIETKKGDYYNKMAARGASFDPVKEAGRGTNFVPILDDSGNITNYRYMMNQKDKEAYLEADLAFHQILGVAEGQMLDKVSSKEQNRKIIAALKQQYDEEFLIRPHSYVRVAADSKDAELKEYWDLLPNDAKEAVIEAFGQPEIMIRSDLVNITFGYRKLRMTDSFAKTDDEKRTAEKIFTHMVGAVLERTPIVGGPAYLRSRQIAEGWTHLVTIIKDNVVIKNFFTLRLNVLSNISLLVWQGVPLGDIAKYHKEAWEGALDFQRDSAEKIHLENLLGTLYVSGAVRTELEQRLVQVKDSLARNPTAPLIEAGMMPTIVEDVTMHDDPSGYQSLMEEKAQPYIDKIPGPVKEVGKQVFMTHDTSLYQIMHMSTQLSDFVGRYTLHKHLTQRKRNPLSSEEAMQRASDSFVNYDIPTGKHLQWMNDMGFLMFTKYYLRIQRTLYNLYREAPGRAFALQALSNLMGIPLIHDSFFTNLLSNPLRTGPLQILDTWDEPLPIKFMTSFLD